MSRMIRRQLVGTKAEFERNKGRFDVTMIVGADVYWGRDGVLVLAVPEPWADYFHGRRPEVPDDDVLDGGRSFEFDESEFQKLING